MNHPTLAQKSALLVAVVLAGSGCVNTSILGVPLGPQTGNGGLRITGSKIFDPSLNCLVQPGPPYTAAPGRVQLGTNLPNTYVAAFEVQNSLQDNTRASQAPSFGQYGSARSTDIQVVGASIRYEFPTLSPLFRFTRQQRPSDGVILTNANGTYGASVNAGLTALLGVKLIDSTFGDALVQDAEFSTALAERGLVPIIARVTLEGRSGSGARVASNEFSYQIDVMDLSTPTPACDPASQGECPNRQVCLPYQDVAQVRCVAGTMTGGMLTVTCP